MEEIMNTEETMEQTQDTQLEENTVQEPQETPEQQNWRKMREEQRALKEEMDELRRRNEALEYEQRQRLHQSQAPQQPDPNYDPDAWVENRQFEATRQEIKQMKRELANARILAECPDYYRVVNQRAQQELQKRFPSVASMIERSPEDIYNNSKLVYDLIKVNRLGMEDTQDTYVEDRIKENQNRPKSVQSVAAHSTGDPLNHVEEFQRQGGNYTKESLSKLLKEMNECSSSYSGSYE